MERNRQVRPSRQASPGKRTQQPGPARLVVPAALAICFLLVLVTFATAGKPGGDDRPDAKDGAQTSNSQSGSGKRDQKSDADQDSGENEEGPTAPKGPALYKVKPGDSFGAISEKTGVESTDLAELNPDVDPRALQPGQQLKLR